MHAIETKYHIFDELLPPAVKAGEFIIAAIGLDHIHIVGMCKELIVAGATLKSVYDPDPKKVEHFLSCFSDATVHVAASEQEVLNDTDIHLIASACIPFNRAELGIRVMEAGKDFFVDKTPMVTLQQLEKVKKVQARTGQKYAVYYCERLHTETGVVAERLIKQGAIGKVIQTIGLGPHRLNVSTRPSWFFKKEQYGGILCDIGSHQAEQFLFYTGATDAEIANAHVENYKNPKHPEFEDFGDCNLIANNGATGYFRVDWLTPDGLSIWGDGRLTILGTDGYMELRPYIDVARDKTSGHIYLVTHDGEYHIPVHGKVGFPYFGQLILDCMYRTETAMTQIHAFKAAELCIKAQMYADAKNKKRDV